MGEAAQPGSDRDEGDELFRAAVEDATPLTDRDRIPPRAGDSSAGRPYADRKSPPGQPFVLDEGGKSGRAPGVSHRVARELAGGQFEPEAILDLHRHTVELARAHLDRFLTGARRSGQRRVLVVTGRAMTSASPDKLRDLVPTWLAGPLSRHVLAFSPAGRHQGSDGAVRVLLRT